MSNVAYNLYYWIWDAENRHTQLFTRNHQCSKNFEIKSGVNSIKCVRGDVIKRTFLKAQFQANIHTHTIYRNTQIRTLVSLSTQELGLRI